MTQEKPAQVKKSGQEVAKFKRTYAKTDARYWEPRLFHQFYKNGGQRIELTTWSIRICHAGRREVFNLQTSNKSAAAKKAREIYLSLLSIGWNETASKYKAKKPKQKKIKECTLGLFLQCVKEASDLKEGTFNDYAKCLRQIFSETAKIRSTSGKYNPHSGGRKAWADKIDSLPLAYLTPEKVQKWKNDYVARREQTPVSIRKAKISCNSVMRQAKALFAKKHTNLLTVELPDPLPFEGVSFYPRQSCRYHSKVDLKGLISDAMNELPKDNLEELKVFYLAVMAGLRRNEIDKLEWDAFDFEKGILSIKPTEHFDAKSEDSIDELDLDEEVLSFFRGMKARSTSIFVIHSPNPTKVRTSYPTYRCNYIFSNLIKWLRSKGITARKPLHELRKEYGSIIVNEHGIFAASRALRHSDIAITAQFYADKKKRVTVGLGSLLNEKESPSIPIEETNPERIASNE